MKLTTNTDKLAAWKMVVSALDVIKETLLSNADNVEKAKDALYEIMKRNNEWYDEIKERTHA